MLKTLLHSVPKGDCIIIVDDLNYQLRGNIQDYTNKWIMTTRNEKDDHDELILNLILEHNLFTVDTSFSPPLKM